MARNVFFSFHYDQDHWRTQQIRNIGVIEGNSILNPNAWEEVKRKGTTGIKNWIDDNLRDKSCTIVLVGAQTSTRPWINYEIRRSWELKKPVLGIRIHGLKDQNSQTSYYGTNPFNQIVNGQNLSSIIKCHDPVGANSQDIYSSIANNLSTWIEDAVTSRSLYS